MTVSHLPPRNTGPDAAGGVASRLLRALEQLATSVIGEQLRTMLEGADEILFEMAQKAKSNTDQRLYLDTMRVIRLERPHLLRAFQDSLKHSFADVRLERSAANTDLEDLETWSVQGQDETEEKVAVANLESKAETLYQQELFELENRLESLGERTQEAVTPKLIAPGRIFNAFRDTMRGLDVEFPVKLVIYRLAERTLLGNLKDVYLGANRLLAQHGYEPRRTRPAPPKPAPPAPAPTLRSADLLGAAADGGAGLDASALDAALASQMFGPAPAALATAPGQSASAWPAGVRPDRLLRALTSLVPSAVAEPHEYDDTELAAEMAGALNTLAQGRTPAGWMPAANLTLVGRMFDAFYQDTRLPEELKGLLGRLQFPVMKTALADPSFFRNPEHPVRVLVHDVFEMLASADSPTPEDMQRLGELIDNLRREFEVEPARLGTAQGRAPAVTEAEAEAFLAQQEKRMSGHRTRMLEKVRRLAAQELRVRTAEREVPRSVMPLLLSGFGPMLAVQFLRGGMSGGGWSAAIELLERLLDSLDLWGELAPTERAVRETEVIAAVKQQLESVGIAEEKIQRLLAGLVETYRLSAEAPVAAKPAPDPAEVLARAKAEARQALAVVLSPGSWFKLRDPATDAQRWLKVHSYNPVQDLVLLADFSGDNHLKMRASAFTADLVAARAEPVDPSPSARRALKLLAALAEEAVAPGDAPVWQAAAAPH